MILLLFLFVILCVGMIMTLINERDYINIVPWVMALILAMRELNREVVKDKPTDEWKVGDTIKITSNKGRDGQSIAHSFDVGEHVTIVSIEYLHHLDYYPHYLCYSTNVPSTSHPTYDMDIIHKGHGIKIKTHEK